MSANTRAAGDPSPESGGWKSYAPYYAHLGLELESVGEGECVIHLPAKPELRNSKEGLHGGAIASLFDVAMSQAVRSGLTEAVSVATVNMTITYLSAANGGVKAHAHLLEAGTTLAFAEAVVTNENGVAVSRASAIYRLIRRAP